MCSCPMKIHIETAENPPVIATNIIHLAEFQSQPRIKMKPNIISYTQISSACNVLTLNLKVLFFWVYHWQYPIFSGKPLATQSHV